MASATAFAISKMIYAAVGGGRIAVCASGMCKTIWLKLHAAIASPIGVATNPLWKERQRFHCQRAQ